MLKLFKNFEKIIRGRKGQIRLKSVVMVLDLLKLVWSD